MERKKFEIKIFSRNALIILTTAIFAALWIFFSTVPRYEINLKFENVSKGNFSNILDRKNYVIKNYDDWSNLWQKMNFNVIGISQPPFVDFNKSMVIAVFQGEHTSSGYDIEITKIVESNYYYEVFVHEQNSGIGCVSNVFTQPFHVVRLNITGKDVTFSTFKEVVNCI